MTAEKLYSILKFLDELDKKLGLQTSLEAVRDALINLVSSPAHPPHQSALATALDSLSAAATRLGEAITPSQATVIKELGGRRVFRPPHRGQSKRSRTDERDDAFGTERFCPEAR